MFVDNGNQLKNYGMQLQSMGMEIQNFGLQMKNNMLQNIGSPLFQNIGEQIQNMGVQISNIAMQIFNMGIQVSNIIMNQNNINMMNQNNLINNHMMMNRINEEKMNDNNEESFIYNVVFSTQSGLKNNIRINSKRTIEDLLNLFLDRVGLNSYDIQKQKIYFLHRGLTLDLKDKRKIKELFISSSTTQKIEVINY